MTIYDIDPISTATRCSCGAAVVVARVQTNEWVAHCPDCLDPSEDAPAAAFIQGAGETSDEALWAWQERHDEVHEVEWVPESDVFGNLARDVSIEVDRQRGWKTAGLSLNGETSWWHAPAAAAPLVIDLFEALSRSLKQC
jgi:hypothetical protein